ncbi:uncharacterized protein LOC130293238 [Hyla sarda]|uniref:uncharacterized protein LOC130293238 n=1 Tax=Hyla sarda TaxID=327740 RepID=UPI0024C340DA|nr:uncharacterized protein LOC130293238 [Hyla sarda]
MFLLVSSPTDGYPESRRLRESLGGDDHYPRMTWRPWMPDIREIPEEDSDIQKKEKKVTTDAYTIEDGPQEEGPNYDWPNGEGPKDDGPNDDGPNYDRPDKRWLSRVQEAQRVFRDDHYPRMTWRPWMPDIREIPEEDSDIPKKKKKVTTDAYPTEDGPQEEGPNYDGPNGEGPKDDGPNDDGPNYDRPDKRWLSRVHVAQRFVRTDSYPIEDGPHEEGPNDDGPNDEGPDIRDDHYPRMTWRPRMPDIREETSEELEDYKKKNKSLRKRAVSMSISLC